MRFRNYSPLARQSADHKASLKATFLLFTIFIKRYKIIIGVYD